MTMKNISASLLFFFLTLNCFARKADVFIRINQLGYFTDDAKVAIAFSSDPLKGKFAVIDVRSGKEVYSGPLQKTKAEPWGDFHYYQLDFSALKDAGAYFLRIMKSKTDSPDI